MEKLLVENHTIGWLAKPRLAVRKEAWRFLPIRDDLLSWLHHHRPCGLFLYHPRWLLLDFDASDCEQHLAVLAARKLMRAVKLREGRDYLLVLTGGKGVRVVLRYLLPSAEDAKLLRGHLARLAEETYISAPAPPKMVQEAREKLRALKEEWQELTARLTFAASKRNWAEVKRLKLTRLNSLARRIELLEKRATAWDKKYRRVKVAAFLDPAVGSRPQPERISGWDEVGRKWGEILPAGTEVNNAEDYKRICSVPSTPTAMAEKVLTAAREILPRETEKEELSAPVAAILEAEQRREEILKKGRAAKKDFSYLFALLSKEIGEVLSSLQKITFVGGDGNELEQAAFHTAAGGWPLKEKSSSLFEISCRCPACEGGKRRKKGTGFIFKVGGRWWIKCHRASCELATARRLKGFLTEKGLFEVEFSAFGSLSKKEVKFKAGLGTYLSPAFKGLDPATAAEGVLALLEKEGRALISWPLGAGKTTFAAILAARWEGRVWALFPFWTLAEEFVEALAREGVEAYLVPSKKDSCPFFEEVEAFRGCEATDAHKCASCPLHPANRPAAPCKVVSFLTDPPKRGVIVGVHAHLPFALQAGGLVIIDEAHQLFNKQEIPLAQLAQEIEAWLAGGVESEAGEQILALLDGIVAPALGKGDVLPEKPGAELKNLAKGLLADLRFSFADQDGPAPLHRVRFALECWAWDDARAALGDKRAPMPRLGVWRALRALEALAEGKATLKWVRRGWRIEGSVLFLDAPSVPADFEGKLLLLSSTAPPSHLKKALGLKNLPFRGFATPRKGRLIGLIPTSGTGNLALARGLSAPVKNALEIAVEAGAEGLIAYKGLFPRLQAEFVLGLEEEALIGWGRHEGTNVFQAKKALAILGRPTPPPGELVDWLLLGENAGETLFWLLVSPVLQAAGRLRQLWEKEDAVVFVIDRHFLQLQKFLLPFLGPADLTFFVTDGPKDTARKKAALKAALAAGRGKEEEVFSQVYLDLAQKDGVSRQARYAWAGRFFRAQAFAAKWREWWNFVKEEAKNGEKPSFSALRENFMAKIDELLTKFRPRRGPPEQKSFIKEVMPQ